MKKYLLSILVLFFTLSSSALAQQRTVTGKVVTADDETPLPNVTVILKGTTRGTATDVEGNYSIRVPATGGVLVFSAVGFETKEIQVGDQSIINVELAEDVAKLDEVVVVGYGEQSRRKITSSISSVSSDEFETQKLNTVENALQGNSAGVQVTQAGGMIGSPVAVRIRGTSSLNASSQPLYVIDGHPITSSGSSVGSNIAGISGFATNPLINLNPQDIESIQVLKDAAASAIYGSRGANGVVLITTKSGRPGDSQVNVRYSAGFTEETDRWDILTGPQFATMWNDAGGNFLDVTGLGDLLRSFGFTGSNRELFLNDSAMNLIFGTGTGIPNEDQQPTAPWMDIVHRDAGFVQSVNASVSGGNDQTQYFLSANFDDEEGYVEGDLLDRFTARLKVDHDISDKVSVGLNLNPTLTRRQRRSQRNQVDAPITYAGLYFPNVEARNDDGSPNLGIGDNPFGQFPGTPLSNLEGTEIEESLNQLVASADVTYKIIPELEFQTDFTVDLFELNNLDKRSTITTDGFGVGSGFNLNQSFVNYNLNSTLTYNNTFDVHDLTALVGYTMQRSENLNFSVNGNGFPSDDLKTLAAAADITAGNATISTFAFQGFLSRVSYTYKDRYLLTANARVDGSSRFGEDNRFGFFPAVSVGWIVSDESFWQDNLGVVDFFKLRASWGKTGNAEGIGNFPSLGLANVGSNYNGIPGFSPNQVANPELQWEKNTQIDVGIDYGLFNSRLRGTLGYYNKETEDMLLNVPISSTNGFTSITKNVGAMTNWGLEFEVAADIFTGGDFRWTSSFNISTVENEVDRLVDGEDITTTNQLAREGEPLGAFFQREYAGVNPDNGQAVWFMNREPTQDEIDNGTAFQVDHLGNRFVTESFNTAERVITGDPFPDFFGGFRNNFGYKNFDLNVFIQYNIGNELFLSEGRFLRTNLNSVFNQEQSQLDYWKQAGDITDVPRPILFTSNGAQNGNSRYLVDASYVRLKNVTFGYTLPQNLTQNYQVRFFVTGTNLLTWTKDSFWGLDPEVTTSPSTNLGQGNVFFAEPQARTYRIGIDFKF